MAIVVKVKCPYISACCDVYIRCATCMHNEERSYYVHEYPADKRPMGWRPYAGDDIGTDLRFQTGDDLRFQTQTICDKSDWNSPGS